MYLNPLLRELITCSAYVAARCIIDIPPFHIQAISKYLWDNADMIFWESVNVPALSKLWRAASSATLPLLTNSMEEFATPNNKPRILSLLDRRGRWAIRSDTQQSTVDCSPTLTSPISTLLRCNWWWWRDLFINIIMKEVTFSEVQEVREVFHGYPPNFFYTKCDEIRWE